MGGHHLVFEIGPTFGRKQPGSFDPDQKEMLVGTHPFAVGQLKRHAATLDNGAGIIDQESGFFQQLAARRLRVILPAM